MERNIVPTLHWIAIELLPVEDAVASLGVTLSYKIMKLKSQKILTRSFERHSATGTYIAAAWDSYVGLSKFLRFFNAVGR